MRHVLSLSLLFVAAACGQTTTAQLAGQVSDSSGAVIPGAAVAVTNMDTGIARNTTSNELGTFTVPMLQPGRYSLTVQQEGFKSATRPDIVLQVNQVARVDMVMEVGALSEAIEVVSSAPLLAQQTSSLGQVIDNTKIINMPLNGRSPFRLVLLTPGVTSTAAASGQFGDVSVNTNQDTDFSINGGQGHNAEVQIDGVPATAGIFNSITTIPSVDSTQEFKVESNNLSAEWGRFSGGVVNVSTRSGTNQLHGTLYEFLRNSAVDSNEFFNKKAGQPIPAFRMNQFGAAVGGPVKLGKLYNGHNRTFFFADYQGTRWRRGANFLGTVPTDLERAGNFTQSLNATRDMLIIYDPVSTRQVSGQYIRDAFPGNVIPSSRMDPVARKMITYYPAANTLGNAITHVNNFVSNASRTINKDDFSGRVDHKVSDAWRMFGRLSRNFTDLNQPDIFGNWATAGEGNAGHALFHYTTGVWDNTVLLSPTSILNIRYGFARWYQNRPTRSYGFDQRELGMPEATVRQFEIPVYPAVTVEGYTGQAGNSYLMNGNDNHSLLPSWTKMSGRHTIKAGGDFRLRRLNVVNIASGGGNYTFNRTFTRGPDPNRFLANSGNGIATFLLGAVTSGNANIVAGESLQDWYLAGYVQDDIRISEKLTLNLGLRYESETPYTERRDQLSWFDPGLSSPVRNTQFPDLKGALRFAGDGSRRTYNWDRNNFAPRLGFAWSITPATVLRGGAGLFYAPLEISSSNTGTIPSDGYSSNTTMVGSLDGLTPFRYVSNPFPDGLVQPTRNSLGAGTGLGQSINLWDNNAHTPYAAQWNADLQRRLPGDFVADVAYSANRGIKLARGRNINAINPQYLPLGTGLQRLVANPFTGKIGTGTLSQAQVAQQQLLLPYPQYTGLTVMNSTSGNSVYHSLQMKVEKRMSRWGGFLLSYTAGKVIADTKKGLADFGSYNQSVGAQNWYDLQSERALSEIDVAQSLAGSYVLDLPFGPKRKFFGGAKGIAGKLLGGWNLGGVFTYRSGFPLAVSSPANGAATRPNSTGKSAKITTSRTRGEKIDRWFDTAQFTVPAPFTFGNVSRTLPDVRGPSLAGLDAALAKDTVIHEDISLKFRAEFFNAFNTPQLWVPNTTLGNLQFGQISSTCALPRVVQFSLKLAF